MNTAFALQEQAVRAAQENRWKDAVSANLSILAIEKTNVSALNRLGFCYMQMANPRKAKEAYEKVLKVDKYNPIAKKYLNLLALAKKVPAASPALTQETFIEEPGKTKTVQLCRLTDAATLAATPIGTRCTLVIKQHRIAVETESGVYLGSLPDDFSHHLAKLMKGGNTYSAVVKSVDKNVCSVFMKELSRSKKLAYTMSFPTGSSHQQNVPGTHDELLIEQDPLDLSETGHHEDDLPEDLALMEDERGED